jgi:chromosome segregation ATPase
MEITLEAIISIVGLLAGGTGIGGFFVWKYTKRKAQAEAKQAEAEAAKAESEAANDKLDYYQKIIDGVARDRDYYKQERDEYRMTIKRYDERINHLERAVARNGRMVEAMRPFLCGDMKCQRRILVAKLEGVEIEKEPEPEQEPTETETV